MTLNVLAPAKVSFDEVEHLGDSSGEVARPSVQNDAEAVASGESTDLLFACRVYTANMLAHLWNWATPRKVGRVVMSFSSTNADESRGEPMPEIAVVTAKRRLLTGGSAAEGADLAVRVKLPDDSLRRLRDSARLAITGGMKLYWLILPEARLVEVYTSDDEFIRTEADVLTGDPVLSGFILSVSDIFADPMA